MVLSRHFVSIGSWIKTAGEPERTIDPSSEREKKKGLIIALLRIPPNQSRRWGVKRGDRREGKNERERKEKWSYPETTERSIFA